MTEAETAAQESLKEIVGELERLRARLQELHGRLPVPPQEMAMLEGEEDMDVATEVRVVIECVLNDFIGSAIRDLQEAANYRPDEKG